MKKIVAVIEKLPLWYGLTVVFLYSLLTAMLVSALLKLFPFEEVLGSVFSVIIGISCIVSVLTGFIRWIVYALLFHLVAMLLGGQASFKHFLFAAAFPYLIPASIFLVGIILLGNVQPLTLSNTMGAFMQNSTIQLIKSSVNCSYIPCYLVVAFFIRHIYQIKFTYALLSVSIPSLSIWWISELFSLI